MLPMLTLLMACPGFGTQDPTAEIEIPESPTWDTHVEAIVVSNCAVCHTAPSLGGAPGDFRLDSYDDDGELLGAFSQSDRILARAVDEGTMPPSGPLDPLDRGTLERWIEIGSPRSLDEVE